MDNFSPDADGNCEMYLDMDERRAAMGEAAKVYPKKSLPQQPNKFSG